MPKISEYIQGLVSSLKPMKTWSYTKEPEPTPSPSPALASYMGGYGRNPKAVPKDKTVVNAIENAAKKFGVPKEFLYDLAYSESSFNPTLQNTTPEGVAAGRPTGLFQFKPDTWKEVQNYMSKPGSIGKGVLENTDINDPFSNALAAAYLIKNGQLGKWDASQWNWGKYWPEDELKKMGFYKQTLSRR